MEFAISFPVLLLMILFGIDFGRVFLGWVTLNQAARQAANHAAIYPTAWDTPGNPAARSEFNRLITSESVGSNCTLPNTLPAPSFPGGSTIGSPALVSISCQFTLFTPLVKFILGPTVQVSASASFPIRTGAIGGVPSSTGAPLPSFSPGPTAAASAAASAAPSASVAPSPLVSPTPVPNCTVPDLVQGNLMTDAATAVWTSRGFAAPNLIFSPLVPPHFDMKDQSLTAGSSAPCTSSMTVYNKKQ